MNTKTPATGALPWIRRIFIRVGVLPFFLAIALVVFTALSSKFLTGQNLMNVARQSVYLVLVSLGQMLVLISGGFDLSVGAGLALFLTGGVPVSGLPFAFGDTFGFGRWWGIPVPVIVAVIAIVLMWVLMTRTRLGTQIYAVGGNIKAAHLSAINTRRSLMLTYMICSFIAALTGLLLTARVESGEANLGGTIALESIAACVIAGVSLRGGIGRVENVVLGAFFIVLVQNGMNLAQVSSYMQMVLLGALLILAVIFDQLRYRMMLRGD